MGCRGKAWCKGFRGTIPNGSRGKGKPAWPLGPTVLASWLLKFIQALTQLVQRRKELGKAVTGDGPSQLLG